MYLTKVVNSRFDSLFTEKRSKKVAVNIIRSFLIKIISTVITLALIPISLHYTDKNSYGVWLTLSSVITWFNLFDLGLSNGLTNKLSISYAKDDIKMARMYLSTTYSFMLIIITTLSVVFFFICNFINWNNVFNTHMDSSVLALSIKITFGFFCLTFFLKPFNDLLKSKQKHFLISIIQVSGNLFALICIITLGKYFSSKFLFLSIVLGSSYPLALCIFSLIYYSKKFKEIKPKINIFKFDYLRSIFGISFKFFIIQASVIAILTSNNFLISFFVDNQSVTFYNIAYRLFSIVVILQSMIVTPLWPAFTDAYILNDFHWIKKTISLINRWNILLCFITFLILFACGWIYKIWIGPSLQIPYEVNILLAVYVIINIFKDTYVSFINGTGQLNLQTIYSIITIILQVPLAYILIKICKLGLSGILILNIFWVLIAFLLMKYQYERIIKAAYTSNL
ncbi:MAG: oligosaccharide flippase family protein [Thermoproteota archaeon]|nr:oligosaccharide flippase family protein [Thermoproteota archaeon]